MTAILLLLCGSWFDVDDVVEPVTPPAPPAVTCQCGCGKTGCKCGRASGACSQLSIDEAALNAVTATVPRISIVVYTQANCPPCERMKREIGSGDDVVSVRFTSDRAPFNIAAFPTIYSADRQEYLTGYATMAQIKAWLKVPAVRMSSAVGTVQVGTIDGAAINAFLDSIPETGVIDFHGAKVTIPPKMQAQIDVSRTEVKVTFTGVKPRVAYGSGWLSISQPVSSLAVNRGAVTLGVDGFPDISLGVK